MEEDAPSQTADPITKLIFKNFRSAARECFELCKESSFLEDIDDADKELLFDKAVFELVIVSNWFSLLRFIYVRF